MLLTKLKNNYDYTVKACYSAYITQAIAINFVPLLFLTFQKDFGLSLAQISTLVTVTFVIQLIVDVASANFVDKIGYRVCAVAAHIFSALGFVLLAILPNAFSEPFYGILFACFFYSCGSGLIEVLVSPIVEASPADNKASVMAVLQSVYCWGTAVVILVSTVFFRVFGIGSWRIMSCLWAIVPLSNVVMFLLVPINTITENGKGIGISSLIKRKIFWMAVLLMICSGASELAMSQWASAFAESGLGVSKATGDLLGAFMFAVLMGLGRIVYSRVVVRVSLLKYMVACAVLCIAAYLVASLSQNPIAALVGCAVTGFSVGVFWPGIFSFAAEKCHDGGTALFALLAFSGDAGCTTGPALVGFVSDALGGNIKLGLLSAVIFPILLIIFALAAGRIKNPTEKLSCAE